MKKLLGILVVLALAGAAVAWWGQQMLEAPYRGFSAEEVFVEIPQGAGVAVMAKRLADEGVVAHPLICRR